jgi:hypothetical protein
MSRSTISTPKGGKLQPIPRGASLSDINKKKLAKHAEKYDKSHISSMRMRILKGKTFAEAHNAAMNRVKKPL